MATLMQWKPGMAESMYDSMVYTHYPEKIAERMLPFLKPSDTLCDGACGVGGLSLALAGHVRHVTAIDCAERAIAQLKRAAKERGITNLTAEVNDLFALTPQRHFDAMVFMQFGTLPELLRLAERHCTGTVFLISRNRSRHRFGRNEDVPLGFAHETMAHRLEQLGIACEAQRFRLQMGQPFRTREEARAFLLRYDDGASPSSGRLCQLEAAEPGAFRWFLPAETELGLLVFESCRIPADWRRQLEALEMEDA